MRILVLGSKEYPMGSSEGEDPQPSGGIEIYTDQLLRNLKREKRLKFTIISRKFKNTEGYERENGIEIHRVRWIKGFYFRNISFNLSSFFKALSLDFDIIFSQDLFATFFGAILAKMKKKPLVAVVHGNVSVQPQYSGFLRTLLRGLERITFRRANLIISLSEEQKKTLEKHVKEVNWVVIPFGIEMQRFEVIDKDIARKNLGIKKEIPIIIFVGRLLKVKGVNFLIEALSKIKDDFTAIIVGNGPDESELKIQVKKTNLGSKVQFLGFRADVPEILAAADIYVLPSLSEGLSLSLLEAKATGCACVVTDIGLPVVDKETALVVRPKDPNALASALELLIRDEGLRKALGENARKDARENYRWDKITEIYLRVFDSFN